MENFTLCNFSVNATTQSFLAFDKILPVCPLTVFAHGEKINLFDEMQGNQVNLSRVVNLSVATKNTVIAGCELAYSSVKRLSAVVAHNGVLVDIVDSCSVSPPYSPAGTVKIFKNGFTFAVLVGGDARVNFIMEKLAKKCQAVIALEPDYRPDNEHRIKQLSALYSLPVLYISPYRIFCC